MRPIIDECREAWPAVHWWAPYVERPDGEAIDGFGRRYGPADDCARGSLTEADGETPRRVQCAWLWVVRTPGGVGAGWTTGLGVWWPIVTRDSVDEALREIRRRPAVYIQSTVEAVMRGGAGLYHRDWVTVSRNEDVGTLDEYAARRRLQIVGALAAWAEVWA